MLNRVSFQTPFSHNISQRSCKSPTLIFPTEETGSGKLSNCPHVLAKKWSNGELNNTSSFLRELWEKNQTQRPSVTHCFILPGPAVFLLSLLEGFRGSPWFLISVLLPIFYPWLGSVSLCRITECKSSKGSRLLRCQGTKSVGSEPNQLTNICPQSSFSLNGPFSRRENKQTQHTWPLFSVKFEILFLVPSAVVLT